MALTQEKEQLLARLNQVAREEFEVARLKAVQTGRPAPPPPVALEAHHIEYPKWLYDASGGAKLVQSQAEHQTLGAGWAETAKAQPKKDEPKKKE